MQKPTKIILDFAAFENREEKEKDKMTPIQEKATHSIRAVCRRESPHLRHTDPSVGNHSESNQPSYFGM
jgi:hypothetical protein